jgi:hypothetical protein
MNIEWGSLRSELGPLPCIACGRMVIYGVATHLIADPRDGLPGRVRRRDLYDKSTQQPHECRRPRAVAA